MFNKSRIIIGIPNIRYLGSSWLLCDVTSLHSWSLVILSPEEDLTSFYLSLALSLSLSPLFLPFHLHSLLSFIHSINHLPFLSLSSFFLFLPFPFLLSPLTLLSLSHFL